MLLCDNKTFYIGITNDLSDRIQQHKNKVTFSTKEYSVIRLVYCEKYNTKYEAARRERQLKGWRKAKKQKLVKGELGVNVCTEFAEALLTG